MQLQSSLNKIMEDARKKSAFDQEVQEKTHQIESLRYANQELQKPGPSARGKKEIKGRFLPGR